MSNPNASRAINGAPTPTLTLQLSVKAVANREDNVLSTLTLNIT